ncbi:XRE family transcriptional regulator, partial [Candidatus Parcubacteria bacterium]
MKQAPQIKKCVDWLRKQRLALGFGLVDLAEHARLDAGQISRLETGQSDLTITTLVKISRALSIPSETVAAFLSLNLSPFKAREAALERIRRGAASRSSARSLFLEDLLRLHFSYQTYSQEFQALFLEWYKAARLALILPTRQSAIFQAMEGQAPLPYPPSMSAQDIQDIFFAGGTLIFQDASAYLRGWRQENNLGVRQVAREAGLSLTVYHRLDVGKTEKVKVSTLLALQQFAGDKHPIFPIFWAAALFQAGIDELHPDSPPVRWGQEAWRFAEVMQKITRYAHSAGEPYLTQWL